MVRLLLHYISGGKRCRWDKWRTNAHLPSVNNWLRKYEPEIFKMVELADKIGKEFDGVITGMTEWGMFVELDKTMIEGMVSVGMTDDYRIVNVMTLTGTHSSKHLR